MKFYVSLKKKPSIPIDILTNRALFYDIKVRKAILNADIVLPSLDAASENIFQKINRPSNDLTLNKYIKGLINFRKEFRGKIWLEIFILPEYNNFKTELEELKKLILKIEPDFVQLNTLDRPGTISNLRGATREELQQVIKFWKLDNVTIIAASPERKNIQSYRTGIETAIVETIARRPCTLSDLTKILRLHISEVNKYLDVLESENKIETTIQERGIFYQIK